VVVEVVFEVVVVEVVFAVLVVLAALLLLLEGMELGGGVVLPGLDGVEGVGGGSGSGSVKDVGEARNRRISLSNSEMAAIAVSAPCCDSYLFSFTQSLRHRNGVPPVNTK
jgi:hypothetical protein